jgi:hypothetical protein
MLRELKGDLATKSTSEIYNKYLLGQDVWLFREHLKVADPSKTYDEFKLYISKHLKVHFNNIAITGSSKTGISFSPKKKFKFFDDSSDLDIILVSEKYYKSFWQAYLDMYYRQIPFPEYQTVYKSLFKGFISLKEPTEKHTAIKDWVKLVNPFLKDLQLFFGIDRQVNYRIYNSWEEVERYHFFGIKQLKSLVQNNKEKERLICEIISNIKAYKDDNS